MKVIPISLNQLLLGGILVLATSLTLPALAQAPTSGGTAPGAIPGDPTAVPLDGGASLLLAGGTAYGLRKLRQRYGRK
jgi:hypothetical protein